ncbi:MAG: Asp23/Gls24 family envelope stress response protein [Coriobacteriia bacterium]|nr:Asp23/Gls24 family envelope stress response protein [Coriobacteriia bacterium]
MASRVAGTVQIANDVLMDLAGYACLESYGVVGMASPSLRDGVAQLLPAAKLRKGIKIVTEEDGVHVDLFVVIEFGTNLTEVSHNLADRVRYVLTNMADVKVATVDVHVQGVKVRSAQ